MARRRSATTRYESVTSEKASGSTYTPTELADFVAQEMLSLAKLEDSDEPIVVLDPAVGEGELLSSLLRLLPKGRPVEVYGFDQNDDALTKSRKRLSGLHGCATIHLENRDFLEYAGGFAAQQRGLFDECKSPPFDLVIANPPYVRTQIMGAAQAQTLAGQFGLAGRVDLYHAFVLAIASVLRPHGVAGVIVSNRFMTTKAGAGVRDAVRERFSLRHVWDLGDTKLFDAAVLPAVFVAEGRNGQEPVTPQFSTIYQTQDEPSGKAETVIEALRGSGVVSVRDGRRFRVQHGTLDSTGDEVWRITTEDGDAWMATVTAHTWGTFKDIGKVRVGVKTCADRIYIRDDWQQVPDGEPELLRPLTTHHVGRQFRADATKSRRQILYTHASVHGRRKAVRLEDYPKAIAYLERHRKELESRTYVIEAGRKWYEIWVPQDPAAWDLPKLIFRDISEEPCFWIDLDQTVVNGDCYWLVCDGGKSEDLLWLAVSVGNSRFIAEFYDHRFNNKLYAGRRRFITQYVEQFPLPDPERPVSKEIVRLAKLLYASIDSPEAGESSAAIDRLVREAFGLCTEEVGR